MSDILIEYSCQETDFTRPIKRAVLRDARLSWGARAIFCFIWDLPRGWSCNRSHLMTMAPEGRTRMDRLIGELQAVGAIFIEPRNLNLAEALAETEAAAEKGIKKKYRAGQLKGWRWIIKHPDEWAVESPLSTGHPTSDSSQPRSKPKAGFPSFGKSVTRKVRNSKKPFIGKPPPKGLLLEGYPNKAEEAASAGEVEKIPSPAKAKKPSRSVAGILCWNEEDKIEATRLEEAFGLETVRATVQKLEAEMVSPLPLKVFKALQPKKNGNEVPHDWWTSESATEAAGHALGLMARPGEDWYQFRQRIRETLNQGA